VPLVVCTALDALTCSCATCTITRTGSVSEAGAGWCRECLNGTVPALERFCSPCPRGRYANKNATPYQCSDCNAGYFSQDAQDECTPCIAGRFAAAVSAECSVSASACARVVKLRSTWAYRFA
jgi:hypothetical protein